VLDAAAVSVSGGAESEPLPAGGSYWRTNTVRLPIVESGTYRLFFRTDVDDRLVESDESNNMLAVNNATSISSVADLIAYAKRNPGKLLYGAGARRSAGGTAGRQIYALFRYIVAHEGVTVVMATHDPVIEEYAHIVYELGDGQVIDIRQPNNQKSVWDRSS